MRDSPGRRRPGRPPRRDIRFRGHRSSAPRARWTAARRALPAEGLEVGLPRWVFGGSLRCRGRGDEWVLLCGDLAHSARPDRDDRVRRSARCRRCSDEAAQRPALGAPRGGRCRRSGARRQGPEQCAARPLGVCFAVAAGSCWAAYIIVGRRVSIRIPGHGALAAGTCVGAVVLAPFSIGQSVALLAEPSAVVTILGVAVLGTVIPYSLQFSAMRRLSSRSYGVLASLEPVIAAIVGWIFLAQSLTWMQAVAIAVVVAASLAATVGEPRRAPGARETSPRRANERSW
ncbi:EamA family transporter [Leifsonia sp. L25]|uniref:EamA family transporter n=1 Tax=Leifsonia sp. L25 TaxID=3423957 RepID=UPI003D6835F2